MNDGARMQGEVIQQIRQHVEVEVKDSLNMSEKPSSETVVKISGSEVERQNGRLISQRLST